MAGIEGIDELTDFANAMREVSGEGRSDGIQKARRDALRATIDDFIDILVEQIRATETVNGGTLDSRTSPYDSGGTNESDESTVHMSDKQAWESSLLGNDTGVIFPKPEVNKRARWLEFGTSDHGPSGDTPMYFELGGARIVVANKTDKSDPFYDVYPEQRVLADNPQDALFAYGEPGEVEGVEPQGFFRRAVQVADETDIFKENMANEIEKEFEEEGLVIQGDW